MSRLVWLGPLLYFRSMKLSTSTTSVCPESLVVLTSILRVQFSNLTRQSWAISNTCFKNKICGNSTTRQRHLCAKSTTRNLCQRKAHDISARCLRYRRFRSTSSSCSCLWKATKILPSRWQSLPWSFLQRCVCSWRCRGPATRRRRWYSWSTGLDS